MEFLSPAHEISSLIVNFAVVMANVSSVLVSSADNLCKQLDLVCQA